MMKKTFLKLTSLFLVLSLGLAGFAQANDPSYRIEARGFGVGTDISFQTSAGGGYTSSNTLNDFIHPGKKQGESNIGQYSFLVVVAVVMVIVAAGLGQGGGRHTNAPSYHGQVGSPISRDYKPNAYGKKELRPEDFNTYYEYEVYRYGGKVSDYNCAGRK